VYGPPEAFLALGAHTGLAVLVAAATAVTVWVIAASYSRVAELFPTGAGGYAVSSRLLSPHVGMASGCALLIDYVLLVAVSATAATEALTALLGPEWQARRLPLALAAVVALVAVNLRGVRPRAWPVIPVFAVFLVTHALGVGLVLADAGTGAAHLREAAATGWADAASTLGTAGAVLLVAHAFSMGAATFTGIEAVSNGLGSLREPRIRNARLTFLLVAVSLSALAAALILAYAVSGAAAQHGSTLNASLWVAATAGWTPVAATAFVAAALLSEALLLLLAANTGFADGPRVIASMAADRFWPAKYSVLTDPQVAARRVLILGTAAGVAVVASGASLRTLVVLYSIAVFTTFVLTHLAVVRHMVLPVANVPLPRRRVLTLLVTLAGLALTTLILATVTATKFSEGGWLVLAALAGLCAVSLLVHSRYQAMRRSLARIRLEPMEADIPSRPHDRPLPPRARGRSAALLVAGYNAQGLALLQHVAQDFADDVEELVFVQVGVLDAGTYKGAESAGLLARKVEEDTARYVALAEGLGFRARALTSVGTDLGDEVEAAVARLQQERSWVMVFLAEAELPQSNRFDRWLRGNLTQVLRRRLQQARVPMRVISVRPRPGSA
ncbi:MAG TPA: amino acid permease, partial [Candidatus Thermoplasmatota archaeon]|nr:amino acid permease [Candidatus Thermoplasmatota archaeon]